MRPFAMFGVELIKEAGTLPTDRHSDMDKSIEVFPITRDKLLLLGGEVDNLYMSR